MRVAFQIASVCAVAIGVGLLVAGAMIEPSSRTVGSPTAAYESAREARFYRDLVIWFSGFGAAFLTLGILGIVVPWANVLFFGRPNRAPQTPKLPHSA